MGFPGRKPARRNIHRDCVTKCYIGVVYRREIRLLMACR
nr:MAG TPA: hypothetical protein [Caudoviricetes sp.]